MSVLVLDCEDQQDEHKNHWSNMIRFSRVSKVFRSIQALDSLTLHIRAGTVTGILGPNGAGKTTMLRLICGMLAPTAGEVSVLDREPWRDPREILRHTGCLLDHPVFYERMQALRNLQLSARLRGLSRDEERRQIEDLLRRFELWGRHTERPAAWSQGMRRRLALARALLGEPKLLLLDEPTNDLDPEGAWQLRRHLVAISRERGVTVVVTTHRLREFEDAFDEIAILQKGMLLASGSTNNLCIGFGLPDGSSLESVYLHARGTEVRP